MNSTLVVVSLKLCEQVDLLLITFDTIFRMKLLVYSHLLCRIFVPLLDMVLSNFNPYGINRKTISSSKI